jgi:hypothetical protein
MRSVVYPPPSDYLASTKQMSNTAGSVVRTRIKIKGVVILLSRKFSQKFIFAFCKMLTKSSAKTKVFTIDNIWHFRYWSHVKKPFKYELYVYMKVHHISNNIFRYLSLPSTYIIHLPYAPSIYGVHLSTVSVYPATIYLQYSYIFRHIFDYTIHIQYPQSPSIYSIPIYRL